MNLRSANTMDLDSSQKLFRLVVEHGMSRQSRKRVLRDSSGTNNESQIKDELQPPRKLNRRQRMSLSVIPPPEYISQMFKSKDNIVDCSTQQPKKRMRSELKKNRTKMIDRYNKENFGTNERKTKRKVGAKILSSSSYNSMSDKRVRKSCSEQIDFNLLGTLHADRDYRCWKCPKCKRRSLEDIEYQRGQCGYKSCGHTYCTLCFSDYHPCSPCIQPFQTKKTSSKGRLRRC